MRYGESFAGIGGLSLALESFGWEPAWFAEEDPAPAAVLARHWPDVPNLGDVTTTDWSTVEPVEAIVGGFPCQDISYAGRGAGLDGDRSGLYWHLWDAVRVVRPRVVVLENVAALLVRGGTVVVGSLAALGFDVRWGVVRARDAGAPHRRLRVFIVAADNTNERHERARRTRGWGTGLANTRGATPHPTGVRSRLPGLRNGPTHCGSSPPDPHGERCEIVRRESGHHRDARHDADRRNRAAATWGRYWPAVDRWERIVDEPAPHPLDNGRLNPDLPRWMMGFPAGWCDGMTRTQQLRAVGNAVCPQQARLALTLLELESA